MTEPADPKESAAHRIQSFAEKLRAIRGDLSYRELERRAGWPHEKLLAATAGKSLPDWKTVEYYVIACRGKPDEWRAEWQEISAMVGNSGAVADDTPEPDGPPPDGPTGAKKRLRRALLIAASVAIVAGMAATALFLFGDDESPAADHHTGPTNAPSGSASVTATTTASSGTLTTTSGSPAPSDKATDDNGPGPSQTTGLGQTGGGNPDPTFQGTTSPQKDVQEQRVVDLVQQQGYNWVDIEYWRHDASTPGEVQINGQEVFTNLGAKLTIVPDSPEPDRALCGQATGWRDRISFSELHIGSHLCALSHVGHYASMTVRLLPASSNGEFTFYGITWWNGE